jgi:hypothetical protein
MTMRSPLLMLTQFIPPERPEEAKLLLINDRSISTHSHNDILPYIYQGSAPTDRLTICNKKTSDKS